MKTSSFVLSNRDHSVDGGHDRQKKKPGDSTKSDKKSDASTSTRAGTRQR